MTSTYPVKLLGEVCDIVGGGTPSKRNASYYTGDIPWATVRDMKEDLLDKTEFRITKDAVKGSSTNVILKGNIIIATRVGLGKVCILANDTAINQDLKAIVPKNSQIIDGRFLYYWLKSISTFLVSSGKGMTVHGITVEFVKSLKIPLPEIEEQKRIVALLDECFAAIAKAKANAEQNLRNAQELFENTVESFLTHPDDLSTPTTLGEVCSEIMTGPFGSMLHKSDYVQNGIPVVNPQNIVDGQIVPLEKTMIDKQTCERLKRFTLKADDIVIARRGEMGRCGVVKPEQAGWLCGTGSFVIRLNTKKANTGYVNLFLSSAKTKKVLEGASIGATMSNLNQGALAGLKLSLPSLDKQEEVVRKLSMVKVKSGKLKSVYYKKLDSLGELQKTILQKAFAGDLVTNKVMDI